MLVDENALFSLQTLSCDDLTTDDVSPGPGHFRAAWLRVGVALGQVRESVRCCG